MILKGKRISLFLLLLTSLLFVAAPRAAERVRVYQAELAVPFGTAEGDLMTINEYLVFVNRSDKSESFAIHPDQIQSVDIRGSVVTVAATEPVQTVRGQSTRSLTFRLTNANEAAELRRWKDTVQPAMAGLAPGRSRADEAAPQEGQSESPQTYQVVHDHFVGECTGTLRISDDGISYDSTNNIDHSRRWSYSEIRELDLVNPYKLEVDAFTGTDYNFKFIGTGMNPSTFNQLIERIGKARGLR